MWTYVSILSLFSCSIINVLSSAVSTEKISLRMPDVTTRGPDSYLCTHIHLTETKHLTGFDPVADMHIAHHMLLFKCSSVLSNRASYPCSAPCYKSKIIYAWARQAPSLNLPKDVAFEAGPSSGYPYLVLQVHYLKRLAKGDRSGVIIRSVNKPQPRVAGVFLMMSDARGSIPAHAHDVRFYFGCKHSAKTKIYPFAFRTHAHTLGRTIFAYQFSGGLKDGAALIGRASPQWPQAFYNSSSTKSIEKGDVLIGACVYDSMHRNRVTHFGGTHRDEMCNFYMMYSRARADPPLTLNQLDACGEGVNLQRKTFDRLINLVPEKVMEYLQTEWKPKLTKGGSRKTHDDAKEAHDGFKEAHDDAKEAHDGFKEAHDGFKEAHDDAKEAHDGFKEAHEDAKEVHDSFKAVKWLMKYRKRIGQVSGVSIDSRGWLYVFHRGDRVWNASAFDGTDRLTEAYRRTPIKASTILIVDRATGSVVDHFGANLFYMPHGIHVDANDDVWVTDVGLHQVMKFKQSAWDKPVMTLGEAFEPGSDVSHFCKPTDVTTFANGDIFVADGYCNSRILKFSRTGRVLGVLRSREGSFVIPHSLTRVGDGQLCVADRVRARVECFSAATGRSMLLLKDFPAFGSEIYAVTYEAADGGLLHGVTTRSDDGPKGFTFSWRSRSVVSRWGKSLKLPHDLAIAGNSLYVAEISQPYRVVVFERGRTTPTPLSEEDEDEDIVTRGGDSLRPLVPMARNVTGYESKGLLELLSSNSPLLIGVVIVLPLAIIVVGAMTAHLHKNGMCPSLCRRRGGRVRADKERGRFEPLLNDESDSDETEDILNIATMKRHVDQRA